MTNQEMITFWGIPIEDQNSEELRREHRMQKYVRYVLAEASRELDKQSRQKKLSRIREDKLDFLDIYIKALDGLTGEIEDLLDSHRADTRIKDSKEREEQKHIKSLQRRMKMRRFKANHDREGIGLVWDKEKFMLVARDRGYMTEDGIIYAVQNELGLDRDRAKLLLNKGKFTWGQVMCVGALLKMTPKEFCDIFLSGYFEEYYGDYVASYTNIDKSRLLLRAVVPNTEADTAKAD